MSDYVKQRSCSLGSDLSELYSDIPFLGGLPKLSWLVITSFYIRYCETLLITHVFRVELIFEWTTLSSIKMYEYINTSVDDFAA